MRDGHFLRNCWIVHVMKPGMKGAAPHVTSENFQLDQWTQILESYSTSFLSKLYPFQTSNVPSQWQIEIEGFYYRVLLGLSRRPLQESPFFFQPGTLITSSLPILPVISPRGTDAQELSLGCCHQSPRGGEVLGQILNFPRPENLKRKQRCLSLSYHLISS